MKGGGGKGGGAARAWAVGALIAAAVFLGHYASRPYLCGDTVGSIYLSLSILEEGDTDLDEYAPTLRALGMEGVLERHGEHVYWLFPVGVSLVALPVVAGADLYFRLAHGVPLDALVRTGAPVILEAMVAALAVALAAVLLYLVARRRLSDPMAAGFALLFAFGTSAWSVATRALWQHGPSMLMLSAALLLLDRARERPSLARYAGIPLLFSYVVRPTNSIAVALLGAYVLVRHRDEFLRFAALSCVVAVPFLLHNLSVYGFVLPPYYLPGRVGTNPHYLEALAGNLVSPARGLLVYSPFFAFALAGAAARVARRKADLLEPFLLGIVVLHWLAISSFPHWWAGWSFGYRFFSDMIPFLMYLLLPFLASLGEMRGGRRALAAGSFALLAAVSVPVHYAGANLPGPSAWNSSPRNVDQHPERIWDWGDPPFLR